MVNDLLGCEIFEFRNKVHFKVGTLVFSASEFDFSDRGEGLVLRFIQYFTLDHSDLTFGFTLAAKF